MSVEEARKAIDAFFTAFNARDIEGLRNSLHYPHVRLASNRVFVAQERSDIKPRFDFLTEREGWSHSSLDKVEVVHASDDKVHFAIEFSRYKEDGTRYVVHQSLWIATRDQDHWGILARSSFAP